MTNSICNRVKDFLQEEAFAGFSPTQIAEAIGVPNSSYVMPTLKKLVAEGWAYRMEYDDKPKVVYGREDDDE